MASVGLDPSVGTLLRYSSVTVIIVLDAESGVDWTDGGTDFIELAAVLTIHPLDMEFDFEVTEGPEPRQLRKGWINRY